VNPEIVRPVASLFSVRKPRNRTLTDIVAAGDTALCLALGNALAGLFLLVRGQRRLTAELDALFLGVGSAAHCAFENAPP